MKKLIMEKTISTTKEEGFKITDKKFYDDDDDFNIGSFTKSDIETKRIISTRKITNKIDKLKTYNYKDGKIISVDTCDRFNDTMECLTHHKADEEEFTGSRIDLTDGNKNILSSSIMLGGDNEITIEQHENGEVTSLSFNIDIGGHNIKLSVNGTNRDCGLKIAHLYIDDDESVFNEKYRKVCDHELICDENKVTKETRYVSNGYNMVESNKYNFKYQIEDDKITTIEKYNDEKDKPIQITEIEYQDEGTEVHRQYMNK